MGYYVRHQDLHLELQKSKSKNQDLLSGIPDSKQLDLLLDGLQQIMGLKENRSVVRGPLFTQVEIV